MTDGILLAETQSDPLLRAYDTIIVDEAHERSLNIDFLLGHLRQILPRRPDLRVVVTSATIDAERFANHFAGPDGPAPVIQVSGRLYPVEIRWRPFVESRDHDLGDAICDAVDELWRGAGAAGLGRRARLPARRARDPRRRRAAAQAPSARRRGAAAVRAPVASSSRTRCSRRTARAASCSPPTSPRPRSRCPASATSSTPARRASSATAFAARSSSCRSSRSARRRRTSAPAAAGASPTASASASTTRPTSPARPKFTDPEIVRSSLAGVILRMQSLNLGSVEDFPFLEAPPKRAIADGYQLLNELGATDGQNALTTIGRELARLPLDPRIGRMILEARDREALREVLDRRQRAERAGRARPPARAAAGGRPGAREVRRREVRVPRHAQALGVARALARRPRRASAVEPQARAAAARQLHLAAPRARMARHPRAAAVGRHRARLARQRQPSRPTSSCTSRCSPACSATSASRATRTSRTSARAASASGAIRARAWRRSRGAGSSPPSWSRRRGSTRAASPRSTRAGCRSSPATCIKTQLLEPHWEKKAAQVIALERATLYGIVIYANRRVDFAHRRSGGGARDLHPRGARRRRVGDEAAVRRRQPQADRAGRGARAQVAAPGRARRRRADLRLLRPAGAGRRPQRRDVRALVSRRGQAPAEAAAC